MSSTTPLTDAINALTTRANGITGASDTTLSDAVDSLIDGYGTAEQGSEVSIDAIDTIVVPSDTRAVNIDLSTYFDNYDILIIAQDITLTASDWLYYSPDVDTATGGSYNDGSKINHVGICFWAFPLGGSSNKYICGYTGNMNFVQKTGAISNLYIYTYVSTKMITANSSFKVYGGNYANL